MNSAMPHSRPAVDESILEELLEMSPSGPALITRLFRIYLDESPRLIKQALHGFASGDAAEIHIAAHTLKSSSAQLGATKLADIAGRAEAQAKQQNLEECGHLLEAIQLEYAAVATILETRLGEAT